LRRFHRIEMGSVGCHGPSVPVKHAGRKLRAPWPARQTAARKKKPATPVPSASLRAGGMTASEKREENKEGRR